MSSGRFFRLSDQTLDVLEKLAAQRGRTREEVVADLIHAAAAEAGLSAPQGAPFLELEAVEESTGIGPGGRVRKVHFKAVDETGEQDLGDFLLPDDTTKGKKKP